MSFNTTRKNTIVSNAVTNEGGAGFTRDPKMELYSLVVTSFLSGDTYYEKGQERLSRLKNLLKEILQKKDGKEFIAGLAVYARNEMYMRSSPTMLSAELFLNKVPNAVNVAKHVWIRGDEHLEALAYVKGIGETRPKQMLKAIANRLNDLSVYTAIKYASTGKSFSQRDALRLAHPTPKSAKQSAIFKYITQGWDKLDITERTLVPEISKMKEGDSLTWEQQISTKGSTKENWETIIPNMGYMALLRNLRNFLEKDVSYSLITKVATKLSDKNEVANSKQLPFRFLNAYNVLSTLPETKGKHALGKAIRQALDYSISNLPELSGNTLVLVDISGSMHSPMSINNSAKGTSTTHMIDIACILGAIVSMGINGETWPFGTNTERTTFSAGSDTMTRAEIIKRTGERLGWGTDIARSFRVATNNYNKQFDRCIVLTDMQSSSDVWSAVKEYRRKYPKFSMYTIDLRGYEIACLPHGNGCYQLAGFSDKLFNWMSEEEASKDGVINKITDIGKLVLSGSYSKNTKKSNDDDESVD